MEIKHTIEILTKDIQDIEKLVRNLNNYPSPPKIELDIALSKLRNVYDLLSMIASDVTLDLSIREDVEREILEEGNKGKGGHDLGLHDNPESDRYLRPDEQKRNESIMTSEKASEKPVFKNVPETSKENIAHDKQNIIQDEHNKTNTGSSSDEIQKKASILAEKFAKDKSINDKIASKTSEDKSHKFSGEAIDSIRRNVGINDRFMIIRELMNGDNDAYVQFIENLDHANNLSEAINQIKGQFINNPEHQGVEILTSLAKRKFISR